MRIKFILSLFFFTLIISAQEFGSPLIIKSSGSLPNNEFIINANHLKLIVKNPSTQEIIHQSEITPNRIVIPSSLYNNNILEIYADVNFKMNNLPLEVEVLQFGDPIYAENQMYGFNNRLLKISSTDAPNLSQVKSLELAFGHLIEGSLSNWDVSSVEDMSFAFNETTNEIIGIANWNVSNVKKFTSTFSNALNFNEDISGWNTQSATDMSAMFEYTEHFNQPIGNWNVSNVVDMSYMFYNTKAFNQPIINWNVSNVTDMRLMFNFAQAFNQSLDNWDVRNVVNFEMMFSYTRDFNSSIKNWHLHSAQNVREMFSYTTNFNGDLSGWDISNVNYLVEIFLNATAFNNSSLSGWNPSSAHTFIGLFSGATSFNQDISSWDVSNGVFFTNMFYFAESYNQPLNSWDVSNGENFNGMFEGAVSFNQPLNNWNVSSSYAFVSVFSNATAFNQDISSWEVSNSTNFSYLFTNAISFNQPLNSWDVSNGENFNGMFEGAVSFNQSLNNWNVSNGNHFENMFLGSTAFNQDISTWNMSNATEIGKMFNYATNFNQNLSNWHLHLISTVNMFQFSGMDCQNITNTFVNWSLKDYRQYIVLFYLTNTNHGQSLRDFINGNIYNPRIQFYNLNQTSTCEVDANLDDLNQVCSLANQLIINQPPVNGIITVDQFNFTNVTVPCYISNAHSIWYTAQVPESGSINIIVRNQQDQSLRNLGLSVFRGICTDLQLISCTNLNFANSSQAIQEQVYSLQNLNPGETVYINLASFSKLEDQYITIQITDQNLSLGDSTIQEIKVYPNPFESVITINNPEKIKKLTVLDISGKVLNTIINPTNTLNLSNLSSGVYLLKIETVTQKIQQIKLIKK